jgi:phosphatidylglycerol---prolipoprotein diacylglyceryl transferase
MNALAGPGIGSVPVFGYFVINIDPVLFRLGGVAVHWYGLMYVVAICIALWAILRYTAALGIHEDQVWGLFLWTALGGLIGGRLYYVVQQPDLWSHYILQPYNIIAVWNGGMAFFGAIFLASAVLFALAHNYGMSPWIALDGGALFATVGQIFGRIGNVINGDIVGYAVTKGPINIPENTCANAPCVTFVNNSHIPWYATVYLNPNSFHGQSIPYVPAAVFEIGLNLVILAVLWQVRFFLPRLRAGYFFVLYLALYAVSQIIVFFVRDNVITPFLGINVLKQAQWTAIFVLVFVVPTLLVLIRRYSEPWRYSAAHPVPWPPKAASLIPADRIVAAVHPSAGAANPLPNSQLASEAESDVVEAPPWQPAHPSGGRLRNLFGTRTSQETM